MGKSANEIRGHHNGGRERGLSTEKPEDIQREIQQTRAEMDDTVVAIQNKFSPQQLVGHAIDVFRDAVREGSPRMMEVVRHNPIPSSLIALGVGWLVLKAVSPAEERVYPRRTTIAPEEYEAALIEDTTPGIISESVSTMGEAASSIKEKSSELAGRTKEKASKYADQAKEKATRLVDRTKEKASRFADQTKEKASELTGQAKEKASELAGQISDVTVHQYQRARQGFGRLMQDNPLVVASVAAGIGAAIGFGLPETSSEKKLMGETRDKLIDKAKQTGAETMEKVGQVAQAAGSTIEEEVKKQDIL